MENLCQCERWNRVQLRWLSEKCILIWRVFFCLLMQFSVVQTSGQTAASACFQLALVQTTARPEFNCFVISSLLNKLALLPVSPCHPSVAMRTLTVVFVFWCFVFWPRPWLIRWFWLFDLCVLKYQMFHISTNVTQSEDRNVWRCGHLMKLCWIHRCPLHLKMRTKLMLPLVALLGILCTGLVPKLDAQEGKYTHQSVSTLLRVGFF